jgi:hypothetical protein
MTRFNRVPKNPKVPAKVEQAWRLMQNDPAQTLQTAAAAVGLTTYRLRRSLNDPHVRKWVLDERRLQLDTINVGNPEALRPLRDTSENAMAAVGAIQTLEAMKELVDPSVRAGGAVLHSQGLVVQIITAGEVTRTKGPSGPPPMQIEGEAGRDALEPSAR